LMLWTQCLIKEYKWPFIMAQVALNSIQISLKHKNYVEI
jgi:hypothetical protein